MLQGDSSFPRPEYPRPDRQRGQQEGVDWLNLNGPWEFRFDPHRRGVNERWFAATVPPWPQQIIVPFCWESLAAWGENETAGNDHYFSRRVFLEPLAVTVENHRSAPRFEVGWYRREVEIPEGGLWSNKQVILTVGAADFFTDCWCNGIHLGHHEGGYVPFEFDLTSALQVGGARRALITLRVEDPVENREQPVGKQWGWYTTVSGIWQTVFIEPRSIAHIDYFRLFPDIDQKEVRLEVVCAEVSMDSVVTAEITTPDHSVLHIRLHRDGSLASGTVRLDPLVLWELNDPKLHRVELHLLDGRDALLDTVRGYFGMRKLATVPAGPKNSPGLLRFNNRPVYLRGALYQSYHPGGVYTAWDAATLRADLVAAREAGFDFLRIHIKLDDPLLLYYADLLGILLMQDFPNFGEGGDTPLGRERFEAMMRAGIVRDFNHPSIISWCLFNETWGFGGQTNLIRAINPRSQDVVGRDPGKLNNRSSFPWIHAMWILAKQLDPTRLIEDMSVVRWDHLDAYGHADTDINSWHFYQRDYSEAKKHIAEIVAQTFRGSTFNYIEGFAQRGAALINSEFGGVGALDGDRDVSWTFKFLTNELRRYPELSAYIYTELTDVEWEHNGILNYDRTKKEFGYPVTISNQADVLPIDAPPIVKVLPHQTMQVPVFSSHFDLLPRTRVTLFWDYSFIDGLGAWHRSFARGTLPISFTQYRVELAAMLELQSPKVPGLCTLSVEARTENGEVIASNFVQHFIADGALAAKQTQGCLTIFRQSVWNWRDANWSGAYSPRAEAERCGVCFGEGFGFFEWVFQDDDLKSLDRAQSIAIVAELSAHRRGIAQTDSFKTPTGFEIHMNGESLTRGTLPDHPHDTRGSLSYLRGGDGAYGYMVHRRVEQQQLREIAARAAVDGVVRLRFSVPENAPGGLTLYDFDNGRFPISLTLIVESPQSTEGVIRPPELEPLAPPSPASSPAP